MKFDKLCEELSGTINTTPELSEKEEFFHLRTNRHVGRVKRNCEYLNTKFGDRYPGLLEQVEVHDASKYVEPELTPYIDITWMYKCKDDGVECDQSDEVVKAGERATFHHIKSNKHHAEYWDDNYVEGILDGADRDGVPGYITDASGMDNVSLLEMVADWTSMSQERQKSNSARFWADSNIGTRWEFTEDQKALIYEAIEFFEELGEFDEEEDMDL